MKTGDRIRILREDRRMTQEELAKAVGYKTRSSIAKIETGESDPPQKMLKKIADALGVIPAELLDDSNNSTASAADMGRPPLMPEEAQLLSMTRKMTQEEKQRVLDVMRLMFPEYRDDK